MEKTMKRPAPPMTREGIDRLRFAIVRQACIDYNKAYFDRRALERKAASRKLSKSDSDELMKARSTETECLAFFHGGWYAMLCDIDPDALIKGLTVRRLKEKEYDL